jgi:hypothetical protein
MCSKDLVPLSYPSDDEDDEDDVEDADAAENAEAVENAENADAAENTENADAFANAWLDQPLFYSGPGSRADMPPEAEVDHDDAKDEAEADANDDDASNASNDDENDDSDNESWEDIDRALVDTFERVPEAALQARVEQWLREQRDALFPFFFSCKALCTPCALSDMHVEHAGPERRVSL